VLLNSEPTVCQALCAGCLYPLPLTLTLLQIGIAFPASLQKRKLRLSEANHWSHVIQKEAADLGLDLGSLTSSLNVSTRAETPELEGKSLNAPVTALCPLCTMSPQPCVPSCTMSLSLCLSLHTITNTMSEWTCPLQNQSWRLPQEASSFRRSQPRSAVKRTWRTEPGISFILRETEAQIREGLVQVSVSRGGCTNSRAQPLIFDTHFLETLLTSLGF
jgi:hypothetical protein